MRTSKDIFKRCEMVQNPSMIDKMLFRKKGNFKEVCVKLLVYKLLGQSFQHSYAPP